MNNANDPQRIMSSYLQRVRAGLRELPEAEVSDIFQELRSHIRDRAEEAGELTATGVTAALKSLGRPGEVASLYLTENLIARAESSRSPWLFLRSIFRWATLSMEGFVVCLGSLFGYYLSAVFLYCGMIKLFHPERVGLWMLKKGPYAYSFHLGLQRPSTQEREILGWWIIPIGLVAGVGLIRLTIRFGLWSIRRFQRSRAKAWS